MRHDPVTYRNVCASLDDLFKRHPDSAATAIRRYLRIRSETATKQARIAALEEELGQLKKVDTLSRKRA